MTIYALSSGGGRAGIAIIRVSGKRAGEALEALTASRPPLPRQANFATIFEPGGQEVIDRGIVIWFPQPRSFTGEDVAEFHVHGGPAVVAGVLEALGAIPGLRGAEPGEFTRRAFENGKLDLTQVEAIADLIDAETEAQRRQARRQLDGALGNLYTHWRDEMVKSLAHLEAYIDFPDEEIPADTTEKIVADLAALSDQISRHLDDQRRGERLREGFYVAIVGAPNVGKSSLLNELTQRDAAIVSSTAGTTRDVVEVSLNLAGFPVVLADTAGLRESADEIEAEGVRRSRLRARDADLRLAMFASDSGGQSDAITREMIDDSTLVVINKIDLVSAAEAAAICGDSALGISAKTGQNVDTLTNRLVDAINQHFAPSSGLSITRQRHRQALTSCLECLTACREQLGANEPIELAVENLRLGVRAVGRITGIVDIEDILDVVFRDFCIGK